METTRPTMAVSSVSTFLAFRSSEGVHGRTDRQQGDLISFLLFFFKIGKVDQKLEIRVNEVNSKANVILGLINWATRSEDVWGSGGKRQKS
jgi:hypothetical protein